ncbi:hypothetical protein DI09_131p10, partial [Mitosporidium daphniae]
GSINKYKKSKTPTPARTGPKGDGSVTIRFEMPFNIWCGGCNAHIAMGVRFNAQKKKVGDYFTTPILSFRMKCAQCPNWFEIQTDPKETDYKVIEGARRKIETWVHQPGSTVLRPEEDVEVQKKRATNAFFRLEKSIEDENVALEAAPYLERLFNAQKSIWKDDYRSSQVVRQKFRSEKEDIEFQQKIDAELLKKISIGGLQLLPEHASDIEKALSTRFNASKNARPQNLATLLTQRRKNCKNGK